MNSKSLNNNVKIFFSKALKNCLIDPIFAAPISSLEFSAVAETTNLGDQVVNEMNGRYYQ
jgi:hypothetical protein